MGDCGFILMTRCGKLHTYKGFGTIENPSTSMRIVTISHYDLFDGRMLTDEERVSNIPTKEKVINYRFTTLNFKP